MEIGKTYVVSHSRKGKFTLHVTSMSDEWVTGVIVDGTAGAMMEYNEKYKGEELTARKSFIRVVEEL